jgi:hypothetical protein
MWNKCWIFLYSGRFIANFSGIFSFILFRNTGNAFRDPGGMIAFRRRYPAAGDPPCKLPN